MAHTEHIRLLAQKWLDGSISPEEEKEFAAWYNQFDDEGVLEIDKHFAADRQELKQVIAGLLNKRIDENEHTAPQRTVVKIGVIQWSRRIAAVLAGTLVVSACLYYYISKKTEKDRAVPVIANTILPGKNGALLTLADGKQIVLDSLKNGLIATQQGVKVALKDGQIKYSKDEAQSAGIVYNTLSTPRGRQWPLALSDGTKVWLNAASSIKYPTVFAGSERKVSITGEVYLDVAKDKARPFIVEVNNNVSVEVLGTHFNINAYPDEDNISTTLLEGSIRTISGRQSVLLKPGQQAMLNGEKVKVINDPDLDVIMSWKGNSFLFNFTPLDAVLRQLSRWYDVDVVYEKNVPDIVFSGEIKKDLDLSQTLTLLNKLGAHFRIEGQKLIVLP